MKLRLLLTGIAATLLMAVLAVIVSAQEGEVPPPYAGLKNPFPWDDASAQGTGKGTYQRSCLGCHGINGASVAAFNFALPSSANRLEEKPDSHFWVLSEGRLNKGMPPYKSLLSEEQRWQVLTYLWSLGKAATEITPTKPAAAAKNATLRLDLPARAESGKPLALKAGLQDDQGKPVAGAAIRFFLKASFFINGLMEIGEALTNSEGVAVLEYIPRHTGEIEMLARYDTVETTATVKLPDTDKHYYLTHIGIDVPSPGQDRVVGTEFHLGLEGEGFAPPTVLRLPTGPLAWLAPLLWTAMAIWIIYFYVMYLVYRIPIVSETRGINTRRIPLIGMVIVVALGILLILMLVTSPLSHPHLL